MPRIGGVVGDNLRKSIDWLPQGKRLLTVRTDCELDVGPADLAIAPADIPTLNELFTRYEFKTWVRQASARAATLSSDAEVMITTRTLRFETRSASSVSTPFRPGML